MRHIAIMHCTKHQQYKHHLYISLQSSASKQPLQRACSNLLQLNILIIHLRDNSRLLIRPVRILDLRDLNEVLGVGAADTKDSALALAVLQLAFDADLAVSALLLGFLAVKGVSRRS